MAGTPQTVAAPSAIVDAAAQERGDKGEVLVLGTSHLSSLPDDFDRTRFEPSPAGRMAARGRRDREFGRRTMRLFARLCARLYRYGGQVLPRSSTRTRGVGNGGSRGGPRDRRDTCRGSGRACASAKAQARGPAPSADSALVQWLRLPASERHAEGALTAELAAMLEQRETRLNESSLIGAHLAARLGHERVYPVDDHPVTLPPIQSSPRSTPRDARDLR